MHEDDRVDCAVANGALTDTDRPPGSPIRDNPEFDGCGWRRRHMTDPLRARESIALYESLGFEVATRDLTPDDFDPRCRACASGVCHSYVLIYTREKSADRSGG
jgi:hypothetical protein